VSLKPSLWLVSLDDSFLLCNYTEIGKSSQAGFPVIGIRHRPHGCQLPCQLMLHSDPGFASCVKLR
jgi:hypothetical protein